MFHGGLGYLRDIDIVRRQIGKKISGFLKVAKRCKWGYPQVIMCYPLKEGEPFPTLYWLTCPYLNKHAGELESKGFINVFVERAKRDAEFREKLKEANRSYAEERLSLLSDNIKTFLKGRFPLYFKSLKERGIGGVSKVEGIKCLHAHLAYYLVGGATPIGEEIHKMLSSVECLDSPKCAMIESCK